MNALTGAVLNVILLLHKLSVDLWILSVNSNRFFPTLKPGGIISYCWNALGYW